MSVALDSRLNLDQWADQWWRLCNLYWIINDDGERIKFYPNDAQERLYRNIWYSNLILKARQQGFTTLIDLLGLDFALFNANKTVGITADSKDNASKIFRNKILYPYNNLPLGLRTGDGVVTEVESQSELVFSNGSSVGVGVSLRSGTLQFLHVSEYGKISAKYPDKAKEIKSGSFNAVKAGQFIFVESTAEGRGGEFYEMTQTAQKMDQMVKAGTAKLTELDFRFHFFAWWESPKYTMNPEGVIIEPAMVLYFEKLEAEIGRTLTPGQKAWYVKKAAQQRDDMKKEFPSTWKEAFEVALDGSYWGKDIILAREQGRIGRVPWVPAVPVNTFWDLGSNDVTAIWFHQKVGLDNRFIEYYEMSGKGMAHFARILQERPYVYGKHYLPHDAENDLQTDKEIAETRMEILERLHVRNVEVVPRVLDKMDGIDAVRRILPVCYFDEAKCGKLDDARAGGLAALENYTKRWDDKLGTWLPNPLHNWASNGADAFMQFAQSRLLPPSAKSKTSTARNWRTA